MTNKIYDFDLIFQLKARQKGLVFSIFLLFLAFLGLMAIFCAVIESNILLTVIFALLLLSFLPLNIPHGFHDPKVLYFVSSTYY